LSRKKVIKFHKFISKRRIISLRHSFIHRGIWLSLMALCFGFHPTALSQFSLFFRISNFFDLGITEETWVVEMCIWCIKSGSVLIISFTYRSNYYVVKITDYPFFTIERIWDAVKCRGKNLERYYYMFLSNKYSCMSRRLVCSDMCTQSKCTLDVTKYRVFIYILTYGHKYSPLRQGNKNNMKISLVNSLSDEDYWYNLRKVYNFYSLF
jgi:hypothetical protein